MHYAWIVLGVTFLALVAAARAAGPLGHQIGAALAAYSAGWVRTVAGEYQLAFWGSGGLCLIAAGLALQLGTRTGRDRRGQSPAADVASLPATS